MTAFDLPIVASRDNKGAMWSGTAAWLVKGEPTYNDEQTTHAVESLTSREFESPLVRCVHKCLPILLEGPDGGMLRVFDRPDGKSVRIRDDYFEAIEDALSEEDDNGDVWPPRYELRQAGYRLGPVGMFVDDALVAVVMPARLINDHLLEESDDQRSSDG